MDTHTERQFFTSLISSISTEPIPDAINSNPLKLFASPHTNTRQIFLTLHVLYPKELLPALDLLDRGLIYHLHTNQGRLPAQKRTYHVRSAQEPPSWQRKQQVHHSHRTEIDVADSGSAAAEEMRTDVTYYETRPWAWNCSCPAFVFAAFPATASDHHHEGSVATARACEAPSVSDEGDAAKQRKWMAGGFTRGDDAPVCKHLLACVLVEHCRGLFGQFVKEREVSLDEVIAWGAGWGG